MGIFDLTFRAIEIVLHTEKFEEQNTQCFTVLSMKHFFYIEKV